MLFSLNLNNRNFGVRSSFDISTTCSAKEIISILVLPHSTQCATIIDL